MKEKIKERIEQLQKAKNDFLANANACEGAISELSVLLKDLDSSVKESPAKKK